VYVAVAVAVGILVAGVAAFCAVVAEVAVVTGCAELVVFGVVVGECVAVAVLAAVTAVLDVPVACCEELLPVYLASALPFLQLINLLP